MKYLPYTLLLLLLPFRQMQKGLYNSVWEKLTSPAIF